MKKILKNVWFWISIFFIFTTIVYFARTKFVISERDDAINQLNSFKEEAEFTNASSSDSSTQSSESEYVSNTSYPFNKELKFESGEKITVVSAENDDSVQFNDTYTDGEHPVVVTAIVENTGSAPLDFNAQEFDLYDNNSLLAEFDASTYGNNIPNSIAAGMKATIVMNFAVKGTGPYSVTFGDAIWKQ